MHSGKESMGVEFSYFKNNYLGEIKVPWEGEEVLVIIVNKAGIIQDAIPRFKGMGIFVNDVVRVAFEKGIGWTENSQYDYNYYTMKRDIASDLL